MNIWPSLSRATRRKLLALGFGLIVALGILGVAEVAVRIGGLAPTLHRIRPGVSESAYCASENPRLGYELKSNYRNEKPDLHQSFPFTNARGQRDVERSLEKRAGWKRILLLGDSVVAGHGIYDVRDTIPLQLERRLAGRNVEVLNFGVGGYCTAAEVELLKVKGQAFHPDVVVLVFVRNDYFDFNTQVTDYVRRRPEWVEWLFVHSHFYRITALRLNCYEFRTESYPELRQWQLLEQNQKAIGPNNVEQGFAQLHQLAQEHGFEVLCVLWPNFLEARVADTDPQGEATDRPLIVEDIAVRHGITTYRLSDFFRRDLARVQSAGSKVSTQQLYTVGDGLHASTNGAAIAADAILEILLRYPSKTLGDLSGNPFGGSNTNSNRK